MDFTLLGKRIKECRVRKHISQAALAERVGLSTRHICAIENARKRPTVQTLCLLANALGTTLDTLLAGYQLHDKVQYAAEISALLSDCSTYERRVIFASLAGLKSALRDGLSLLHLADDGTDT